MSISRNDAVARLLQFVGKGKYGLGKGTNNPFAPSPFVDDQCDCSKAVLWALGQSSHDDTFPEYEGDINVDAALINAKKSRSHFEPIVEAGAVEPGDLVMFPSIRAWEVSDKALAPQYRCRIGHVGMITGWRNPGTSWNGSIQNLSTVECSSGNPAIKFDKFAINFWSRINRSQFIWKLKEYRSDKWKTKIIRYVPRVK